MQQCCPFWRLAILMCYTKFNLPPIVYFKQHVIFLRIMELLIHFLNHRDIDLKSYDDPINRSSIPVYVRKVTLHKDILQTRTEINNFSMIVILATNFKSSPSFGMLVNKSDKFQPTGRLPELSVALFREFWVGTFNDPWVTLICADGPNFFKIRLQLSIFDNSKKNYHDIFTQAIFHTLATVLYS